MNVRDELVSFASDKDRAFIQNLLQGHGAPVLGVKTPKLRYLARKIVKEGLSDRFLAGNHEYNEEYLIHDFILEQIKDYGDCLTKVNAFLPQINNWMVCDQLSPKAFFRKAELIDEIKKWLDCEHNYTVRFGLVMLLRHFTDERFDENYLSLAAVVKSDDYYVLMAKAWFFAEALTKQYEYALKYFERDLLDDFTHNKAIQKATESFRVPRENKEYLKSLRKIRRKLK